MRIRIIGGGMTGLLAANLLLQANFEVELHEENPPAELVLLGSIYDLRVSVLTPVSMDIFASLGIKSLLMQHRHGIFNQMAVWEENAEHSSDRLVFDGRKAGYLPLGYVIENKIIRKLLWDNFWDNKNNNNINKNIMSDLNPDLVIAADGAGSSTREAAGIVCQTKDYQQQAITATIQTSRPHGNIARQRFLSSGPLAFLPLSEPDYCSIVWTNPDKRTQALLSLEPVEFNTALQAALGPVLGEVRLVSERLAFPLKMQQAESYIKPGLVLVGDAAHTVHPLAGMGVNMGFLDVIYLVRLLKQARNENRSPGHFHTLRKYERARKAENLLMLKAIDSFTNPALRKTGLKLTQYSEFLQLFFMKWMSKHGKENIAV